VINMFTSSVDPESSYASSVRQTQGANTWSRKKKGAIIRPPLFANREFTAIHHRP
jgi:hypothetical protein